MAVDDGVKIDITTGRGNDTAQVPHNRQENGGDALKTPKNRKYITVTVSILAAKIVLF